MKTENTLLMKHISVMLLTVFLFPGNILAQVITSNMALNKDAASSSVEAASLSPLNAFDGDLSTFFSTAYEDNQWIAVDLGRSYLLSNVALIWGEAYGKDFDIVFSVNGSFTDLGASTIRIRNNVLTGSVVAGTNTIPLKTNTIARYVRMQGIRRATSYGYTLYEFQVTGSVYVSNLLPVTLTGLTAAAGTNATIIEWATTTEYNNAGFSVERSTDATNFTAVGWVNGINSGTVSSYYSFTDNQVFNGRTYYRLKITDLAGKTAYSSVISVNASGNASVKIYPVPVKDHIMIEYKGSNRENITVSLLNLSGLPVYTAKIAVRDGRQTMMINRSSMITPGSYFLTISSTLNKQYTEQIFLQ